MCEILYITFAIIKPNKMIWFWKGAITVNKKKLKEIIERHGKWLRGEAGGEKANLYEESLRGVDLSGVNLRGADLRIADLDNAILAGADLREANMRGTVLRYANLRGANLSKSTLIEATLIGADLREASLEGAELRGAYMGRADLRDARLNGAQLYRASLYGANLKGADLREANLNRTNLDYTDLRGLDIRGARVETANFDFSDMPYRVVQAGPFGTLRTYITYNIDADIIYFHELGSFEGSLESFKQYLDSVFPSNVPDGSDNPWRQEYMAFIAMCELLKKIKLPE
ncbi:Uncharacterized protein YjbI, contains pentapeptide repeats [Anaerovibrio lipolyticus DSM 3074]|uniref:Uncharacterized protein YjbI, contains pentapeptide repeats n=1 Tax=Anaerovibrio lipolyticus DSM 3074 TaxID=1120997 RepID=A0A1M6GI41_9FIRM|nr:Uncharacterized protein YjbI, contains pentapeptide repeats [Anaerovibrio lipolyticus DSM 3074]